MKSEQIVSGGDRSALPSSPSLIAATRFGLAFALAVLMLSTGASAQEPVTPNDADGGSAEGSESSEEPMASFFAETTVTATGSERDVFEIATPVTVITAAEIERLAPRNPAELLRDQPGVDVNGVGPNQARPVIRGQRGLRVLFLQDGLRLNNARRQTDFGEITGLVDMESIGQVEVVRGPASVLYGSDAIGGVMNLVTRKPTFAAGRGFTGSLELGYASASDAPGGNATFAGRSGAIDWQLGYASRSADAYDAPSGSFGEIELDPVGHTVKRNGQLIDLTPLEFDLLACLLRSPHEAFSREKLLERVWGYHHHGDTRLVNVHMARLRSKIEDDADDPHVIRTVRGIGYQAVLPN